MIKDLVSVEDLSTEDVLGLIKKAQHFKQNETIPNYQHLFASNLFFENSTRTHLSFEVAQTRLKIPVIQFNPEVSAVKKGETLYDTTLTLSALGVKLIVIRHPEDAYYKELLANPNREFALINGGDGSGQHPTQCLLDLMTIYEEFKTFKDLKIAIIGDLSHSRVAKSNMQMLTRLGAKIYFSAPDSCHTAEFDEYGQFHPIDELVPEMDVIMLLRVQYERHHQSEFNLTVEEYHQKYGLTVERYKKIAKQAIIMHPAPVNRGIELAGDLVEAPQSRIVQQMKNGVFMRMAIIDTIVKNRKWEN